jgi:hypothetical protein
MPPICWRSYESLLRSCAPRAAGTQFAMRHARRCLWSDQQDGGGITRAASYPTLDDARDERYTPELRAGRVADAEGRMRGGEGDYFADGGVRFAFEDTLSVEDMRALARRRWRGRFF